MVRKFVSASGDADPCYAFAIMASYLEQSLAALKGFEGTVRWMYRDTVGKITVGVGLMLPDAAAACALAFQIGGRAATQAEIAADYARVDAMAAGHSAAYYRVVGGLELPPAAIDSLLLKTLTGFEEQVCARMPEFATLPDAVKLVLLDMAYNLGVGGLFHEYPKMLEAIASGDWTAAAAECQRHGIGEARNAWTRAQLLSAGVVKTIQAAVETPAWKRLAYGLIGWGASLLGR
jgi:GH24 family phage-related lysozyme (muramidase)